MFKLQRRKNMSNNLKISDIRNKDLRKLIKPYLSKGWCFLRSGKHYFFKHDNGNTVTVSKTASDFRAFMKIEKDFIREGK